MHVEEQAQNITLRAEQEREAQARQRNTMTRKGNLSETKGDDVREKHILRNVLGTTSPGTE